MTKEIKQFTAEEIKPYPKNAKKHPKKQLLAIAKSLKEFGWQQPIVVDEHGVIIVGHGRYAAWREYGKPMALGTPRIETSHLTPEQSKAYRLADNKLNESDWDEDMLIEELRELDRAMFALTGFNEDMITDSTRQDDEVPELPTTPKSKNGERYQLGNHVLMCGDSTSQEDVAKLMDGEQAQMCFTDPPYNVDYQGGMNGTGKNKRSGIMNDKMGANQFYDFLSEVAKRIIEHTRGGGLYLHEFQRVNNT